MNKQEFLAFSLPYELKTIRRITNDELPIYSIIGLLYGSINFCIVKEEGNQDHILPINIIMPILHPLSDCFKEIEHNGERFVPSKEIHKYCPNELIDVSYIFSMKYIDIKSLPFWAVIKLIEWKFDLFNGIKNKEAIDVNNLETNPYK